MNSGQTDSISHFAQELTDRWEKRQKREREGQDTKEGGSEKKKEQEGKRGGGIQGGKSIQQEGEI